MNASEVMEIFKEFKKAGLPHWEWSEFLRKKKGISKPFLTAYPSNEFIEACKKIKLGKSRMLRMLRIT
jgi:hypothetical protein